MKLSLSIIVGLLAVIAFLFWRLSSVSADRDSTAAVLQEKEAEITYFKAHSGKIVGVKPAAEINVQDFQNQYSGLAAELRDIKVKVSGLKAVLKASMEATGSGQVRIVRDTVRLPGGAVIASEELFVEDGYLDLKATINPGIGYTYKYLYKDTILWAAYDKKKWLFGNEKLYADFQLSNPNARAVNMTSVLIRQRDKRFNISIGAGYDPFTNQVRPGIYVGYSLIRL